jgi:predicted N-acetyltransferase YhbS
MDGELIRAERPSDAAAIRAVLLEAFPGDGEAWLVDELRGTDAWIPELSLVAVASDAIVGHLLMTRARIEGAVPGEALALAPMAVVPAWHHRGVGGRLVRRGLEEARRLGFGLVVVLGHATYYPRFGFRPARSQGIEAPFRVPDDVWMALDLGGGGLRGTVVYAPPFAQLE